MASDLPAILRALPTLAPTDLCKLRDRVKLALLLNGGGPDLPPAGGQTRGHGNFGGRADYLLAGILAESRRRGLLGTAQRLAGHRLPAGYAAAAQRVCQNLEASLPEMGPADYAALGQLAARALAELLEGQGQRITPRKLLRNVNRILEAIDHAFPGYLQAKILHFCWRSAR
jgi:hypothetical protein